MTASTDKRSIPVTLATQDPVPVYDKLRGIIGEVLVMTGAELPGQVPLIDAHDSDSVRHILGSIRELSVKGDMLRGVAYFASKQAAQEAYTDAKEGHLTDVSIGARRLAEFYIEKGESRTYGSTVVKGPARIVTRWRPVEGSPVPIGADSRSTFDRTLEVRRFLCGLGMPREYLYNEVQAIEWAKRNTTMRNAKTRKPSVTARRGY